MTTVKDNILALGSGSPEPASNPELPTLYSVRMSPYCQRARLILNYKQIPFQIVNIDIWQKPEWFVGLTPFSKVPVLKQPDGKVIFGSLTIGEYVDDKYSSSKKKLLPDDAFNRAEQKMLIEIIMDKVEEQVRHVAMKGTKEAGEELIKGVEKLDALLHDDYFTGPEVGFVDLMVFPWFDRSPTYLDAVGLSVEDEKYSLKKISAWRKRMLSHPAVRETCYSHECYQAMLASRRSGKPNVNIGLDLQQPHS